MRITGDHVWSRNPEQITQRKMERSMLSDPKEQSPKNEDLRRRRRDQYIIEKITSLKWR